MSASAPLSSNVKQVVPFFRIFDMERSLRFYIDGLGFAIKQKWIVDEKVRWCRLELGGAALMLQRPPGSATNRKTRRRRVTRISMPGCGSPVPRIHLARTASLGTGSRKFHVGNQLVRPRRLPPGIRKPHRYARGHQALRLEILNLRTNFATEHHPHEFRYSIRIIVRTPIK